MNTERLNALALEVQADLEVTSTLSVLDQLTTAMGQMASQPNQAQFQEQVSRFRSELADALGSAPSNQFSPAWTPRPHGLGVVEDSFADPYAKVAGVLPAVALDS